jgi:hypothetical protein
MAKVIKIKKPSMRVTHKDCGALIEFYPNEIKSFVHYDYGGGSDMVYYIVCPNCGKNVEVKN